MRERARLSLTILLLWLLAVPASAQTATRAGTAQRPAAQGTSARKPAATQKRRANAPTQITILPAAWRAALERVSADSMRGHLSFISSDLLEGRKTPSRGLDIAAEYIAAQFRRAGLEPAGDDGYFQTANWSLASRDMSRFNMWFDGIGIDGANIHPEEVSLGMNMRGLSLWSPDEGLSLTKAGTLKVAFDDASTLSALSQERLVGRVIVTNFPDLPRGDQARALDLLRRENEFLVRARALGAPLVVSFSHSTPRGQGGGVQRLIDPESGHRQSPFGDEPTAPLVTVYTGPQSSIFEYFPSGVQLTFFAPALAQTPVKVRNVAGILRGSDPTLKDTYVIVSAHYDHLGVREGCDRQKEDCIYNGANDDGSGTVGVIEMASALAKLQPRPKRSILFITFFGEELGLLGSRYYGRHPLVPLAKTVAQVNLEQIGRTDDSEGPQVGTLAVTGFGYSDVGATLVRAGETVGVKVYQHPTKSDLYFSRSDNQSLADAGVPAHTVGVAFEYPDYHAVGDEWPKVDFVNMERVVRAVAAAVLMIADDPREPRWNEQNPKAAQYVEAWKKLHAR
jgi:hypothetical protein